MLIPLAAIAAILAAGRSLSGWPALHRFEQRLFAVARRWHTDRRLAIFADLSALGSSTLVTILAVAGALGLGLAHRWRDGFALGAACALAGASATWLKQATHRTRPASPTGATFGSSFPSSHTAMGTALWLTAGPIAVAGLPPGALSGWIMAVAAALVVAVGLSRVLLHAHYLSDVLAGWVLGAAWAAGGALWRAESGM